MATTIINPSGTLPSRQAAELQANALGILTELEEQLSKAYCVASAGNVFANRGDAPSHTEAVLFETIQDMLMDTSLLSSLKQTIDQLATLTTEARHG